VDCEPAFYSAVSQCIIENNTINTPSVCGILVGDKKGNTGPISNPKKQDIIGTDYRQIHPPIHNKIISNTIIAEKGKHIILHDAPDNRIDNNNLRKP
jgi:hypothetical protein